MSDCPSLDTCAFFKEYETDESRQLALKGFVRKYCKGAHQESCVRKKVKGKFGLDRVPVNMMPNGSALAKTSSDKWDQEIKGFIK